MNCLIVFAHPEPFSFSAALKDRAVRELEGMGHRVVISDLYRMGWNGTLGPADFEGSRADADYLDLSREQGHAFANVCQSADVVAEQAKVTAAELVLFQFPLWRFSMPAIVKGWIDRVFSRGFADSAGRKCESGQFKGKRAMLCLTTGTAATLYEANGMDGDLHHVLWPIHNWILGYTGFTVLPPFAAWMPGRVTADEREAYLDAFAKRLQRLDQTEQLFFHPWSDYDETQRLKPGIAARSGVQWNPQTGQTFKAAAADHFRRQGVPPSRA